MAISADIYWTGSLLPETIMILFTQLTVVLCKHSMALKLFYLLQFFSEVAQNSTSFPGSENSLTIPGFSRFLATLRESPALSSPTSNLKSCTNPLLYVMTVYVLNAKHMIKCKCISFTAPVQFFGGGGKSLFRQPLFRQDVRYSNTFFCTHKRPSPFFYTYPIKTLF